MKKIVMFSQFFLFFLTYLPLYAVIAAGILPYTFKDGTLLFLLGKESNGWSDFGGFAEHNETALEAAIKEFSEETRYVFGKFSLGINTRNNYSLEKLQCASNDYIAPKITTMIKFPPGNYSLYLAHVDYIPAQEFTFAFKTPDYDKEEYAWVPALELLKAIKEQDPNNAYYNDMKIRKEFVEELASVAMQDALQNILKNKHH